MWILGIESGDLLKGQAAFLTTVSAPGPFCNSYACTQAQDCEDHSKSKWAVHLVRDYEEPSLTAGLCASGDPPHPSRDLVCLLFSSLLSMDSRVPAKMWQEGLMPG